VKITTSSGEVAVFSGGRFKISQRGGITTLTQGVVSVRDEVNKKTFVLRKGKSYTARAKKG